MDSRSSMFGSVWFLSVSACPWSTPYASLKVIVSLAIYSSFLSCVCVAVHGGMHEAIGECHFHVMRRLGRLCARHCLTVLALDNSKSPGKRLLWSLTCNFPYQAIGPRPGGLHHLKRP